MHNDAIMHHSLLTRLGAIMYETFEELLFQIESVDLEIAKLKKQIEELQRDRDMLESDRKYFVSRNKNLNSKEQLCKL